MWFERYVMLQTSCSSGIGPIPQRREAATDMPLVRIEIVLSDAWEDVSKEGALCSHSIDLLKYDDDGVFYFELRRVRTLA